MGEARRVSYSTAVAHAVIAGGVLLAGCGIRKPETACEWITPRSTTTLLDDIKRAEDIAIRHVDAKAYGVGVVRRESRQRCEAQLMAAIADSRHISLDAVRRAQRQLDHRGFDWFVNLPMAMFTLAMALLMTGAVRRRFPDDRLPRVVAIGLLSMGLGVLVIGVGQVWAGAVEVVRIGNDHLGHRGLRIPWGKHRATTFTLAVLATWLLAAMPALRTRLRRR